MTELDDHELLAEYARTGSEAAFAVLVARYVNLVHSAAWRFTGNPHHAEEITQAVFIILARKAGGLRRGTVLSGWLYQTARLTAANFVKGEIRRQRREQEAYMQSILTEPEPAAWKQIAPLLDEAMGWLGETDRNAIVLRFFENKTARQVAAALKLNEAAAHKRVDRALEKLHRYFARRGVSSTTAIIAGAISAHSVQTAPVALAKAATAAAITKGAAASISTLTLAKAALITMKWSNTQTVVAAIAAAAVLLGTGTYFIHQSKVAQASSIPGDVVPIIFANDAFVTRTNSRFLNEVDPDTRRTTNSAPAGHIKCLITPTSTGSADYLKSNSQLADYRFVQHVVTKNSALLGKRIRISGWIKTSDVRNWAGAVLTIVNDQGHIFANDEMTDRPIHGTTDWQQIEIVADVPKEACRINFYPVLYGTGELWCDDFQIDVVPANTHITDDQIWHVWSPNPNDYSVTTDYNTLHDGHSTLCITYTPPGAVPRGSWMWWGQDIRTPEKYLGHTVRMTAWIKTENISNVSQNLRPKGPNFKLLATCTHSPVTGTTDWTQHVITCVIPKQTQCLDTGFAFTGSGKVWIDMETLKYEIADGGM